MAIAEAPDTYSMGANTLRISRSQLHGKIRSQALAAFRTALQSQQQGPASSKPGVILLQGGQPFHVYSSDGELIFKQESYMHYLFGVMEEDWLGALDVHTGCAHLFMPRLPDAYAVWMGALKGPQDFKAKYAVDAVHYTDDMPAVLAQLLAAQPAPPAPTSPGAEPQPAAALPGPLHVLQGTNSDSGRPMPCPSFAGIDQFQLDGSVLFSVLTECRVKKSAEEVAIIRWANQVGAAGHVAMMQMVKPGVMEYQLEAAYLHHCYSRGGCRLTNYTPISASGPNGAVLHYGHAGAPNDRQLQDGDMVLVDMGCEYYRYGSDITCSWPANGRFTPAQQLVYNAVLAAHQAVLAAMAPGVVWTDMHTLANRCILAALREGGLVTGSVDDLMAADIGALFMPHGLGHFLGLDTHDVGGYLPGHPPRSTRPGFKSLRTARKLEAGMVITVEPGCYFNAALLLPALEDPVKSSFLVKDAILSYMSFGGVRIEDNVVVTEAGAESLTVVPRTVEEIEAVMAGGAWPMPS